MHILRLIVGVVWLALGTVTILLRRTLVARNVRRSGHVVLPAAGYFVMGSVQVLLGIGWLVAAFV